MTETENIIRHAMHDPKDTIVELRDVLDTHEKRTLTTSKGQTVETAFGDVDAAAALIAAANGEMPRNNFKRSLVDRVINGRGVTDKQRPWLHLFAVEAVADDTEDAGGEFARIIEMMDAAAENKKYPKFLLPELNLRLQRTASGREPGSVLVLSHQKRNRDRALFARIHRGGNLTKIAGRTSKYGPHKTDSKHATRWDEIVAVLRAICDDPEGFAAAHGHENGTCMFCGAELTDERSVTVGYGPVCADNHNLQWG